MEINIDRYLPLNTCEQIDALIGSSFKGLILYNPSVELEVMMAIRKKKMQIYFKDKLKMERANYTSTSDSPISSNTKENETKIRNHTKKKEDKSVAKRKRIRKNEAAKLIIQGLVASLTREDISLEEYYNEYKKALKKATHYNLKNYFEIELKCKRAIQGKELLPQKEEPANKEKKKSKSNSESYSKTFKLDWQDVHFRNGKYTFAPQNSKKGLKALVTKDPMSLESYNYIRNYFEQRLPNVTWKYNTVTKEIKIIDEIQFKNAILMIVQEYKQARIEKRNIIENRGNGGSSISFTTAMSKASMMSPSSFKIYKSQFIDYLVEKQLKEYKIVPLNESFDYKDVCGYTESAFLFSLEISDKYSMIVLENVNPNRSTLLFYAQKAMYMDALRAIHSFMQSGAYNKRSELRSKELSFEKYGITGYSSINHEYLSDWIWQLNSRANRYKYFYL